MNRAYTRTMTNAVLSMLTEVGPMTTQELMLLTGRTDHCVRDSLRRLRKGKLIHIERYQYNGGRGRQQPVYAVGDKPDAVEVGDSVVVRNARYRQRHRQAIIARDAVRAMAERSICGGGCYD